MSFLGNRAITLLGLHLVCKRFAQSFGDLFGPVFLYSLGLPLPVVFFSWAAQFVLRLFARPFARQLQVRLGLRKSVILGTLVFAGLWPILGTVDGLNSSLAIFLVYSAIADCLYWLPFHAYYAALGDSEHRGKQIGVREGLVAIVSAAGPALGGIMVATFGFQAAFIAAGVIVACASLFLFKLPNISPGQPLPLREAWQTVSLRGLAIFAADGMMYHAHVFTWALVVYLFVGSYTMYGGLAGLTAFFAAIAYLTFGHLIDSGRGRIIGLIGCIAVGAAALVRSQFAFSIPTIIAADFFFALALPFYASPMHTMIYNAAKKSPNTHWFHFFAEMGYDIGTVTMLTTIGIAVACDIELRTMMTATLVGIGLMAWNVATYFSKK